MLTVSSEIALPEDMVYEAGDYISILPRNPVENVTRVLSRFSLLPDQNVSEPLGYANQSLTMPVRS